MIQCHQKQNTLRFLYKRCVKSNSFFLYANKTEFVLYYKIRKIFHECLPNLCNRKKYQNETKKKNTEQ